MKRLAKNDDFGSRQVGFEELNVDEQVILKTRSCSWKDRHSWAGLIWRGILGIVCIKPPGGGAHIQAPGYWS